MNTTGVAADVGAPDANWECRLNCCYLFVGRDATHAEAENYCVGVRASLTSVWHSDFTFIRGRLVSVAVAQLIVKMSLLLCIFPFVYAHCKLLWWSVRKRDICTAHIFILLVLCF